MPSQQAKDVHASYSGLPFQMFCSSLNYWPLLPAPPPPFVPLRVSLCAKTGLLGPSLKLNYWCLFPLRTTHFECDLIFPPFF